MVKFDEFGVVWVSYKGVAWKAIEKRLDIHSSELLAICLHKFKHHPSAPLQARIGTMVTCWFPTINSSAL